MGDEHVGDADMVLSMWREEAGKRIRSDAAVAYDSPVPSKPNPDEYGLSSWRRDTSKRAKDNEEIFYNEDDVRQRLTAYDAFLKEVETSCTPSLIEVPIQGKGDARSVPKTWRDR